MVMFSPIGSMYAIYGNIYHQYTPNVSIYTIHGSYGSGSLFFVNRILGYPETQPPIDDLRGQRRTGKANHDTLDVHHHWPCSPKKVRVFTLWNRSIVMYIDSLEPLNLYSSWLMFVGCSEEWYHVAVGVIMDCYCSVITHQIGGSPINTNQPTSSMRWDTLWLWLT